MNPWYWPVLSVLVAGGIIISGCSSLLKSPEISVKGVTLTSFSLSSLSLDVTLLVTNRNPFGITLRSLSFDIYYQSGSDWIFLSHGEKTSIVIHPGENEVTVPVTVSSIELLRSLASLIASGKLTLRIQGTATPDFYGIAPEVPFSYTTTVTR